MALPSNDDFANCELSAEELDAVAAGWGLGSIVHSIEHGLKSFFTNPVVAGIAAGIVLVGAFVAGGGGGSKHRATAVLKSFFTNKAVASVEGSFVAVGAIATLALA